MKRGPTVLYCVVARCINAQCKLVVQNVSVLVASNRCCESIDTCNWREF